MSKDSKIKGKEVSVPDSFDSAVHKTEWTCAAKFVEWINEIIADENLGFGVAEVETKKVLSKRRSDIFFTETPRSKKTLCMIEAKIPSWDVFSAELKEDARKKANERKSPYFCTLNFKKLIWWDTKKANDPTIPEEEQIINKYDLSTIEDLDEIEKPAYRTPMFNGLKQFLLALYADVHGEESRPRHAVDELLIYRLQEKIRVLARYYKDIIYNKYHKDKKFAKKLRDWFADQSWHFADQDSYYDKAARQTAYLIVNKVIFYNLLQAKRPKTLDKIGLDKDLTRGPLLKAQLQGYFNLILEEINYETIYTTDFIDELAIPDVEEVVNEIKELVYVLNRYDFSTLGYDIIGRIFESLIPAEERHYLGQYFTSADVVDLILSFCLKSEDDKVLDPACGAGTFLVRTYQHKKMDNQMLKHEDILSNIWGTDIAKFPAHLATINLAINALEVDKNYPNILQEDFFTMHVGPEGCDLEKWRKRRAKTLGVEEREVIYPRWFDAIVGNPPYTRQEEIADVSPDLAEYKQNLIESALMVGSNKIANITKRAGVHAYFFVHGWKFLKDGGRFGFIVSNSWLDVDYGKGMQEFFLKNYKITAIIESKVERWFEEADVNTCIVILEKCNDEKARNDNTVRFVYLKKPLRHFIPPTHDMWEKKLERIKAIGDLRKTILAHFDTYENDDLRVYCKQQGELWDEGWDEEKRKFVGAKWGKYLRAPEIFFKILEKGKGKLVPLKEVADVRRGFTTGANEFFYLTEEEIKRRGIEKEYLEQIIFSLKEVETYRVDKTKLKYKVIICHKEKSKIKSKNLKEYIKWGEEKGFSKRPTCATRSPWYSIGNDWEYAPLIFPAKVGERMPVMLNEGIFEDKKLYGVIPKSTEDTPIVGALLNSTLTRFLTEFTCRQLTGAQAIADIDVAVVSVLPIPVLKKIKANQKKQLLVFYERLLDTSCESIFKELGASSPDEVSLDKVKPDRRELDKIIMGDILGLTDDEQLEVYRAVIDLVKSRLDKANSVKKIKKTKEGVRIKPFVQNVIKHIEGEIPGVLYKEKILTRDDLKTIAFPSGAEAIVEHQLMGWVVKAGKEVFECRSELEAKYIALIARSGISEIAIPQSDEELEKLYPILKESFDEVQKILDDELEGIFNPKEDAKLRHAVWMEIMK
ncbi:hypothetical protein DRQ36_04865 [bacterium]|nr:MAG: hypothetical protein DRQ36_04865 [bacterium]